MRTFAIIPAAGRSVRMGQPKLLLPWGDSTLIETVLAAWRSSSVTATVMVVHPDDYELAALGRRAGADVVQPTVPPPEMKDSILVGLSHLASRYQPQATDAWLIAPADLPSLKSNAIDRVISACARGLAEGRTERIYRCTRAGEHAHPTLFAWSLAEEVAQLSKDEGLNALVARLAIVDVDDPDAAICDIDTPEDYQRGAPGGAS